MKVNKAINHLIPSIFNLALLSPYEQSWVCEERSKNCCRVLNKSQIFELKFFNSNKKEFFIKFTWVELPSNIYSRDQCDLFTFIFISRRQLGVGNFIQFCLPCINDEHEHVWSHSGSGPMKIRSNARLTWWQINELFFDA